MKTNHTFPVSAIIRRYKVNSRGEAPIYIRVNIDIKRTEIVTKYFLNPHHWDNSWQSY